jgi:hypothetical protein
MHFEKCGKTRHWMAMESAVPPLAKNQRPGAWASRPIRIHYPKIPKGPGRDEQQIKGYRLIPSFLLLLVVF